MEYITIEKGTIIEACGLRRDVNEIIYQSVDMGYADIEFKDKDGRYGHYKSSYDKGRIILPNGTVIDYTNTK